MATKKKKTPVLRTLLLSAAAVACAGLTGCQVDIGGQTLPSPYYISDDVQYFAPGSEFPLAKEAASQKAYAAQREQLER